MDKIDKNLEKYEKILRFKSYAKNTIKTYSYYVGLFFEYTDKPLSQLAKKDAYAFIENCSDMHYTVKNQVISSIKLLYKYVVGYELTNVITERPRKSKPLPRVIDKQKLQGQLNGITNLKHRAILTVGYRCGLRVSEVCNLLIRDIDSNRKTISVRNSKFNKDREIAITEDTILLLRMYYRKYKPVKYLFEGQRGKYSTSSCQKIFKKYIDANKSFHTLRHSFGTTLVERGVNLRIIQKSMGHNSSRTTEIYTHVSSESLQVAAI